ncbi:MAG: hypothetical protein QM526_02270 [Alphaproteobacteria bacterium]|nr:hypothetical protein [Alphaproteobacteria bacterium]
MIAFYVAFFVFLFLFIGIYYIHDTLEGILRVAWISLKPEVGISLIEHFSNLWYVLVVSFLLILGIACWYWFIHIKNISYMYRAGYIVFFSTVSYVLARLLKEFFAVPRPTQLIESGYGYPSMHTTGVLIISIAIYALCILLMPHASRLVRISIASVLGLACILTGYARIALGVHWIADILGAFSYVAMVFSLAAIGYIFLFSPPQK